MQTHTTLYTYDQLPEHFQAQAREIAEPFEHDVRSNLWAICDGCYVQAVWAGAESTKPTAQEQILFYLIQTEKKIAALWNAETKLADALHTATEDYQALRKLIEAHIKE